MEWDNKTSPEALRNALNDKDDRAALLYVNALLDDLERYANRVPDGVAKTVVTSLGDYAAWGPLLRVCEALRRYGQNTLPVRRWHARARIESEEACGGAIDELLAMLEDINADLGRLSEDDPVAAVNLQTDLRLERIGVQYLLGLGYQRLYLLGGPTRREPRRYDLNQAKAHFLAAYKAQGEGALRSGVRYIALETHRVRIQSGEALRVSDGVMTIAEEIRNALVPEDENWKTLSPSKLTLLAEIHVALGQNRSASEVIEELASREATASEIGALRGALETLWALDESSPPGDRLLPPLRVRYEELSRRLDAIPTGEDIDSDAIGADIDLAEGVEYAPTSGLGRFAEAQNVPLRSMRELLEIARSSVARVEAKGETTATAFLVEGGELMAELTGKTLLLTASYAVAAGKPPAGLVFQGMGDEAVFQLESGPKRVSLSPNRVACLFPERHIIAFEVDLPEGARPLAVAATPPKRGEHIWLVGLRSLGAGTAEEADPDGFFTYRAASQQGASGSPVLNSELQVFAMHSMGRRGAQLGSGPLLGSAFALLE